VRHQGARKVRKLVKARGMARKKNEIGQVSKLSTRGRTKAETEKEQREK